MSSVAAPVPDNQNPKAHPLWQLVERACASSPFGLDFASEHVAVVYRFAERLAPRLGARMDVVGPAVILHDIAAIESPADIPRHQELGAERGISILRQHGFANELLPAVAECIRRHGQPVRVGEGSPEVVCLSHADALSQMAHPSYWLSYAQRVRGFSFQEGRAWYRGLLEQRWKQLDPSLVDMARPHYLRAMAALADDTTAQAEPASDVLKTV